MTARRALHGLLALQLLVRCSQSMVAFAVAYWIFNSTQSAGLSAAALFARLGPSILLSLYSGWLTDVRNPAQLYRSSLVCQCVISALLAALSYNRADDLVVALVLIAIASAVDSFLVAAFQRLALNAVADGDPDKTRLIGRMSLVDSIPPLVGPVLGVVASNAATLPGVFLIDCAVCVGAAALFSPSCFALLAGDRLNDRPPPMLDGIRIIFQHRSLRSLQLLFSAQNLLNGVGAGLLAALILGTAAASKAEYASALTSMAVGAILGSLLAASFAIADRYRLTTLVCAAVVGAFAGRVMIGAAPVFACIVAGLSVRTLLGPVANTANQAMWLERIDRSRQGSILGARRLLSQGPYPAGVAIAAIIGSQLAGPIHANEAPAQPVALPVIFIAIGLLEVVAVVLAGASVARAEATGSASSLPQKHGN